MLKTYLIIAILSCLFGSCHPDMFYSWVTLKNNSTKGICYAYSNSFPDTSIPIGNYIPKGTPGPPSGVIQPGESYSLVKSGSLESYFTSAPSGTLELFIFDANTVQTIAWDTVLSKYLILKRYDLTLDSINKTGRIIDYP